MIGWALGAIGIGLALLFKSKPANAAEKDAGYVLIGPVASSGPDTAVTYPPVITDSDVVVPEPQTEEQEEAAHVAVEAGQLQDWQQAVANAWASGDSALLADLAAKMRKAGLVMQAESVDQLADALRQKALEETNAIREEQALPPVTLPETIGEEPPVPVVAPDQRIAVANQLIVYLKTTKKGSEDKPTVANVQRGLGLTADGLYGIDTALAVAALGVLPIPPWYLPKVNTAARVADFDAKMKAYGDADPARILDWYYVAERTSV